MTGTAGCLSVSAGRLFEVCDGSGSGGSIEGVLVRERLCLMGLLTGGCVGGNIRCRSLCRMKSLTLVCTVSECSVKGKCRFSDFTAPAVVNRVGGCFESGM